MIVMLLVLASSMVLAVDDFGGPGGTEFTLDCGEGYLINGIGGREGALIDQLNIKCINPFKDESQGESVSNAGGAGGEPFAFYCPDGSYASKINMWKSADFISGLQAVCTDGTTSKIFGTEQKESNFLDCEDKALAKIGGKEGLVIDSISYDNSKCSKIPTAEEILNFKISPKVRDSEAPIGFPQIGKDTPTEVDGKFEWNKNGVKIVYDGNNIVWTNNLGEWFFDSTSNSRSYQSTSLSLNHWPFDEVIKNVNVPSGFPTPDRNVNWNVEENRKYMSTSVDQWEIKYFVDGSRQWRRSDLAYLVWADTSIGKFFLGPLEDGWKNFKDTETGPPTGVPGVSGDPADPISFFDGSYVYWDRNEWRIFKKQNEQEYVWQRGGVWYYYSNGKQVNQPYASEWPSPDSFSPTLGASGSSWTLNSNAAKKVQDPSLFCIGKNIGITGASNTVGSKSWANKHLQKLCGSKSKIKVKAVGGYAPIKQKAFLTKDFLTHNNAPLDILIINPSGNSITGGSCKDMYKDLDTMINKAFENNVKKVAIMTVSPRSNWQKNCVPKYNNGLQKFITENIQASRASNVQIIHIENALITPDKPNHCAYCNIKENGESDQRHWNSEGHSRVATFVYQNLFIAPGDYTPEQIGNLRREYGLTYSQKDGAAVSTPSPPVIDQNCLDLNTCKEIDEAWGKLSKGLGVGGKPADNVWVNDVGWKKFEDVYRKVTVESSKGSSKSPVTLSNAIDVSHHQKYIDWPKVKAAGIDYTFIKASEHTTFVDGRFKENLKNAQAAGVEVLGLYHFAQPTQNGAVEGAKHFVETTKGYLGNGVRPVLDVEAGKELGKKGVSDWVFTWLQYVEKETGQKPIIYAGHYARNYMDERIVDKYDLWYARWTHNPSSTPDPSPWDEWKYWQYSDRGSVDGISGDVDLDVVKKGNAPTTPGITEKQIIEHQPDINTKEKTVKYGTFEIKTTFRGFLDGSSGTNRQSYEYFILHDGSGNNIPECNLAVAKTVGLWKARAVLQNSKVSSHYYICHDGTIHQILDDQRVGYHAGCPYKGSPKELCPISNANGRSIGIDLQNYGGVENSYTGSKYTPAQYEAANNLMAYLGNLHNIPIDDKHILAHFEVTKTRKTYSGLNKNDPYPPFDWSKVAGVEYDHQDKNGPKMDALVTG